LNRFLVFWGGKFLVQFRTQGLTFLSLVIQ